METPGYETNGWNMRLGRCIIRKQREKRDDQWVDIEKIIGDPQISECPGHIARGEIDEAIMHISRKNPPHALKIDTRLNEDTSGESTKSNSGNWKGSRPGAGKRPNNEKCEENQANGHLVRNSGEEGKQTHHRTLCKVIKHTALHINWRKKLNPRFISNRISDQKNGMIRKTRTLISPCRAQLFVYAKDDVYAKWPNKRSL